MLKARLPGYILAPLLCLLCGTAFGQTPAPTQASATAVDATPDTGDFVMPPSADIAYQEYVKNNDKLEQLLGTIDSKNAKLATEGERYDASRKKLESALRWLVSIAGKCTGSKEEESRKQIAADDVRQALKSFSPVVRGEPTSFLPKFEADFKVMCQPGAAVNDLTLLRPEAAKDVLDQIEGMRTKWIQMFQQEIETKNKERASRERLRVQLSGAMVKLKTQNERTSNFSDLKWLVLILGVLSVMVMLIVRTFPQELQTEWVASGQVIQFMTVLIILIAILSLGINGILKEETLGTLLGGIGGYVLAQGVGRAALRNALSGTTPTAIQMSMAQSPTPGSPVQAAISAQSTLASSAVPSPPSSPTT